MTFDDYNLDDATALTSRYAQEARDAFFAPEACSAALSWDSHLQRQAANLARLVTAARFDAIAYNERYL